MADRRRTVDCHLLMRKTFELGRRPSEACLRIAASDQYRLHVNGRLVGDGPARSEVPTAYYDTYDLAELGLRKGRNVIALLVHSTMLPQHGQSLCPGGVRVDLECCLEAGRKVRIVSDNTWRVREAPQFLKPAPRRFFPVGFNEKIDFSKELRGWTAPPFDDSGWRRAEAVSNWYYRKLLPRPVPRLRFEDWRPVRVRRWGKVGPLEGVFGLAFEKCQNLLSTELGTGPSAKELTLATFVYSEKATTARFDFGCDNRSHLHVNDKPIWQQGQPRGVTARRLLHGSGRYGGMTHGNGHRFEPGSTRGGSGVYRQDVRLRRGWNSVRVWMWRPDVAYGFEICFMDPKSGQPLPTVCSATKDRRATGTWLVLPAEDARVEDGKILQTLVPDIRSSLEPSHLADWDRQRQGKRPHKGAGSLLARPRGKGPMVLPPGGFIEFQLPADGAGFIDLELRGPKGSVVDVTISEAQTRDGRVRSLYNGLWQTDRLILDGRWNRWLSLDRRAGRYLCLCARQSAGPVEVRRLALRTQHYPASRIGKFECSDWTFTQMWKAGAATVDGSTFDLAEDCPTREKAQWAGDTYIRLFLMAWLWGDVRLSASAIRMFAEDQKPDRWARAIVPSGYRGALVDTCFLLPRWVLDHYRLSGDMSVVRDSFKGMKNLFTQTESLADKRGFAQPGPGNSVYVDYTMPPLSRCGDTIGALQAQYLVALDAAAQVADLLGKSEFAARWRTQARRLRRAVRKHFWVEEEGLFVDGIRQGKPGGTFTAATNYWMLFAGVPTPQQERRILKRLWQTSRRESMRLWSRGESPYTKFYMSEALLSRGLWRETFTAWRGYYGTMLRHPEALSVFEMWNRKWSLKEPVPRNSLVHAFGIGPMAHLACYVAGVKPLKAGFAEILWEPMPGDLRWLKAELPLVGYESMVEVEMKRLRSGRRRLVLRHPIGIAVRTSDRYLANGDRMMVEERR